MSFPTTSTENTTAYEVWQRGTGVNAAAGERRVDADIPKQFALAQAQKYNDDETENARMEIRAPKRQFFVVKVTSTRSAV